MITEALLTYYFMFFAQPVYNRNSAVDLKPMFPVIFNQGQTSSCTSQAISAVALFHEKQQFKKDARLLSRLDLYYQSREDPKDDSGATFEESLNVIKNGQICDEIVWPYAPYHVRSLPPKRCVAKRHEHKSLRPFNLPSSSATIAYALRKNRPVIVGTQLPESFSESDVKVPSLTESIISTHAMVVVGVTEMDEYFILRNSWGDKWKENGHIVVPRLFIDRFVKSSWILQPFE